MTSDLEFEQMLSDINAYLDDPPMRGSSGHRRFSELVEAVEHRRAEVSRGPFAEELRKLDARINALVRRRDIEQHSHDLSTGEPGSVAFLGWDFRSRGSEPDADRST